MAATEVSWHLEPVNSIHYTYFSKTESSVLSVLELAASAGYPKHYIWKAIRLAFAGQDPRFCKIFLYSAVT